MSTQARLSFSAIKSYVGYCAVAIIIICFALPFLALLSSLFTPIDQDFTHLLNTVLPDYIFNSIGLMLGVGVLVVLFGVSSAWFIANFSFTGRKILIWTMILPLSLPTYVIAFIYSGLFDFSGVIQSQLRQIFNWSYGDYYFPEIHSLGGAIFVISLVLYPYVYMLCYVAFSRNKGAYLAARTLGCRGIPSFFKVALPCARPAIVAGVALALMETLADFGAVDYFAIDTLTTGIYRSWFGMANPAIASKLAIMLLIFIIILIAIERVSRGQSSYENIEKQYDIKLQTISGYKKYLGYLACLTPIVLGFILPLIWLIYHAIATADQVIDERFFTYVVNSLQLSSMAVGVVVVIAVIFATILRFNLGHRILRYLIRIISFGYAVPGSVVAVALLYNIGMINGGWIITGSIYILVFAYSFRFLAIALNVIESGMSRINNQYLWLGRLFGLSKTAIFTQIYSPMIFTNILVAALLVFVESVKELPATLIIRPFNFDTLATKAYEYASDERLYDAAAPSLLIVLLGILPVIIISRALLRDNS